MFRKAITAIFTLSAVFAMNTLAQAQSGTGKKAGLTNPGFEEPRVEEGRFALVETMSGWKTTDTHFEIWGTGFKDVVAHEGTQFVELNAYINGTLFQDSTGIPRGSVLEFTFAHRGRSGDDTMQLIIADLGADNALEGGDDTILFIKQYTTGKDAWAVYNSTTEQKIKALGNTVMFAYSAISTATGELGEGNLLDAANFGIGVVSMQQAATGIKVGSWEIHQGGPLVAFDTFDRAGLVAALDKATIPAQKDAGWKQTLDSTVNVHEESAIPNRDKTTVDYTFFQLIVNVPEGAKIKTFQVNFEEVDDSARAWIFNSKHPKGAYFPDADVLVGGQNVTVAADFKDKVAEGENRIVITQYDNMPYLNTIKGIHIIVDGQEVKPATLPTTNSTVAMVTAGDSKTNQADAAEHILTRDLENQKGAVWTEQKINFKENFTINAEIYLGTKDDGADGLALVFQSKGNHIVSDGGGLGYQGISPSIAIEFDTYHNGDKTPKQAANVNNNDPVEDHVGLRTDGNPVHTASDYVKVGNLEDGKYHPIMFEWNAGQQTFNLSLDGRQIFKERSIPVNGLAGQQVYFGFTAATGGLSNEHKVRSISFAKRK